MPAPAKDYPAELYIGGFLIGPQAYSFNRFSFFEAVDKAKEAGANVIEAFPGQRLSPDDKRPFNHDAPPEVWAKAKMKLTNTGVRLVNYGVVSMGSTEAEMRKVFDFATVMGIPCVTTEPAQEKDFALLDKLVKEYDIKVAVHNHPKPSNWDPNHLAKCLEGRSALGVRRHRPLDAFRRETHGSPENPGRPDLSSTSRISTNSAIRRPMTCSSAPGRLG